MNSENWQKVDELLNAALEIEPALRREFLAKIDAENIRSEVESLLVGETEAKRFFSSSAVAFSAEFFDESRAEDALIDQKIGNYKIIGELGHGGMGAVYLAKRDDGKFEQKVAVKLLKRELNTADIRRRFAHERQILAALAHSNIARLLDAGTTDDGLPFLVMEHVEGMPIDEFCERENLDLNGRLELFQIVCRAVAFAHRNLIVHRDLKPTNILVDKNGIPKLLDFGISKLLTPEFESGSENTVTKLGAMTPEYASPEQLRGESVTTSTDVYSLGVILYQLLTAHRPFELKKLNTEEIVRAVCETEPAAPSAASRDAASGRRADTGRNQKVPPDSSALHARRVAASQLQGDLDNIVLKALKKEPDRRYSSVEQFDEDIARHLMNLPVLARPDTFSYRATKFINRNRTAVFAGSASLLTLMGGVAATVWQSRRAEASRIRAEQRFNDVRKLSNSLIFDFAPKIERLQGATEAREFLVKSALEYLDSLAQESGDDDGLQNELAAAYEKIGDLQGNPTNPNFIDAEEAIKSYEKARIIRLSLFEQNPNDSELRRNLAENYRVSAAIYGQSARDYRTQGNNLGNALKIYEKLLAERSGSIELKFALAQIRYDIGKHHSDSRSYAESFEYFERTISALEDLCRENPNQVDFLKLLGDSYTQYAYALSWEARQRDAETRAARAIEIFEPATVQNPNNINLRSGIWSAYWHTSSIYEEQNDRLSDEFAWKSLKIAEETVRLDPANIRAKQHLAKSFSRVGQTSTNTGKPDEAIGYLQKARVILSEITENRTKNNGLKSELTTILMRLGEAKSRQYLFQDALGDFGQAVKIHQDILQNFPGDVRVLRNLALTYEYIARTHEKIGGEKNPTALENYRKELDILLDLESRKSLSESDRRMLERIKGVCLFSNENI